MSVLGRLRTYLDYLRWRRGRAAARIRGAVLLAERGQRDQAAARLRDVLKDAPPVAAVAALWQTVGTLDLSRAKYADAEQALRQAQALFAATLGLDHPRARDVPDHLAAALYHQGRHADARAAAQDSLQTKERCRGPHHPCLAVPLHRLAQVATAQGDTGHAFVHLRRALTVQVQAPPAEQDLGLTMCILHDLAALEEAADDPHAAAALRACSVQLTLAGRADPEALSLLRRALDPDAAPGGPGPAGRRAALAWTLARQQGAADEGLQRAETLHALALLETEAGDRDKARAHLTQGFEILKALPPDAETLAWLGRFLDLGGPPGDAPPDALSGQIAREFAGQEWLQLDEVCDALDAVDDSDPEAAVPLLRALLADAPRSARVAILWKDLGVRCMKLARYEEAEQALRQAEGIFRETESLTPGRAREVLDALSRALLEQDKLEGAYDVALAWLALTDGAPGRPPGALAWPHYRCGQIKLAQESMVFAHLHFEQSLAAQEQAPAGARDLKLLAFTLYGAARTAAELGLRDKARAHLTRGVQIALELELDADLEALLPDCRELRARLDAPEGTRPG